MALLRTDAWLLPFDDDDEDSVDGTAIVAFCSSVALSMPDELFIGNITVVVVNTMVSAASLSTAFFAWQSVFIDGCVLIYSFGRD